MRNTTKLKLILQHYNIDFSMSEDLEITLTLFDKETGDTEDFSGKSYTHLISRAYTYFNKRRKEIHRSNY
ncbi:hypothetical protein KACHI17_10290 [Sediminibacterium sp. KACHI17]|uniref:Uncharacterized protein n=1 Tax=Sediminibacterium sp. KACHI17 TaxID=1751071 RepID=A0AAT9GHZ5_9BACT